MDRRGGASYVSGMGRCTVRALALLLPIALLVGCATETGVHATALRVPAMALDTNADRVGNRDHPEGPDLHAGEGYGARLGMGDRDSDLGILYLRTRHFDFDRRFHDTGGAAGLARGEVGVALARFLRVHVGGGGFVWGYPGTTLGTGAFLDVGLTLAF